MDSRMLAVDRQEHTPTPLVRCECEPARGNEALLVRERERDAVLQGPERRADAGEPDDRVQDDIRLAPLEEGHRVAADLDVVDLVLGRELLERSRPRHERADLEVGMCADDVEGLTADRPGRAEDRDAFHAARMPDGP